MPYNIWLLEKIPFMIKFYKENLSQIPSLGFLLDNQTGVEISTIIEEITTVLYVPVNILKEMNEHNSLKSTTPKDILSQYLNTFAPASAGYKINVIDLIETAELETPS